MKLDFTTAFDMAAPRLVVDGLWRCLCPSIDAALLRRTSSVQHRFTSTVVATQQQQDGSNQEQKLPPSNLLPSSEQQQQQQQQSAIDKETQLATAPKNKKTTRPGKNQRRWEYEKAKRKLLKHQQEKEDGSPFPMTTTKATTAFTTTITTTTTSSTSQRPPLHSPPPENTPLSETSLPLTLLSLSENSIPTSLLSQMTTAALRHSLNLLITRLGKSVKRFTGANIRLLVDYLVKERGQVPDELLYRALVISNWDPQTGSCWELEDILREMDKANIAPSELFWKAAVRLLAIHPDYTLRNLILRRIGVVYGQQSRLMKEVREDVILGLLRERQEELALEMLEETIGWEEEEIEKMEEGGDGWRRRWMSGTGWDTVVYVLGRRGHTEEAFGVLMKRLELEGRRKGGKMGLQGQGGAWLERVPMEVWYFMLEECSRESYLEGTKFLWGKLVESGLVVPSDGMLNNVLNTGARHCDEELATGAFRELAARGTKMTGLHYDALVDCYADQGKLEEALEVLSIKAESFPGGQAEETRSILRLLVREPEMANRVFDILSELKGKRRKVPASGPVVLIEFVSLQGGMEALVEALERVEPLMDGDTGGLAKLCFHAKTIEDWRLIAEAYPRVGTSVSLRKAAYFLNEMVRHLAANRQGDLDLAFARLWDMGRHMSQTAVKYPTDDTLMALLDRCYWERDSRIWAVIDLARKRGIQVDESDMENLSMISKPQVDEEILDPSVRLP